MSTWLTVTFPDEETLRAAVVAVAAVVSAEGATDETTPAYRAERVLDSALCAVEEQRAETEAITWAPWGDPLDNGNVIARLADGRVITVVFLGDVWSWTLRDARGEEVAGNWVATKAEAQQAARTRAAR